MKNSIRVFTFVIVGMNMALSYTPFDTGMITFSQPNKSTFTARTWGDLFFYWSETNSGNRIIQRTDGYWYFAILDGNGEFVASDSIVTLNDSPKSSYKLQRSSTRISEIEAEKVQYEHYLDSLASIAELRDTPYRLGLFFVEFPDEKHSHFVGGSPKDPNAERPHGYLASDYEDMMFSANRNYSTADSQTKSPAGLNVHGSFADYWDEQTLGEVTISSQSGIINVVNSDTIVWAVLDSSKLFYNLNYAGGEFIDSVAAKYSLDSYLVDNNGDYDKIAIIYAGGYANQPGLNPQARAINGYYYQVNENWESSSFKFMGQIGPHTHEFGHTIGLIHVGNCGFDDNHPFYWNLMAVGDMLGGDERNGTCPAGINPAVKVSKGWIAPIDTLNHDTLGFKVKYDYDSPNYYWITRRAVWHDEIQDEDNIENKPLIIELRLRDKFDEFTPMPQNIANQIDDDHYNNNLGGMLIFDSYWDILPADNDVICGETWLSWDSDDTMASYIDDSWPKTQGQDLNENTSPSTLFDIGPHEDLNPHIALQNITWNGTDSSVTFDFYTNVYTGDLSEIDTIKTNMTLFGTVRFYNDIVINSGVTVKVLPGAIIKMPVDKSIYVYGEINSTGTSAEGIRFTSINSWSDWYAPFIMAGGNIYARYTTFENMEKGLWINSATSDADIRYCEFRNSLYGIYVKYNSAIDVRDCSFSNNTYSARFYYADCDVFNNDIDSSKYGVWAYYSDLDMENNEIHYASGTSTSRCGVYLSRSSASMDRNDISNCYNGVKVYNYSGPDLTNSREEDDNEANNYIHSNDINGFYIGSNSTPDLGVYASIGAAPAIIEGGFNYFTDNDGHDVYNSTATTIYAQVNWWEADSPNNYGTVITTYQADDVLGDGPGDLPKSSVMEHVLALYREARMFEEDSLYDEAIAIYDTIIVRDTESSFRHVAMIGIERCFRSIGPAYDFMGKMDAIQTAYPNDKVAVLARYMKAGELARTGELETALIGFEASMGEFETFDGMEEQEAWALFDVGQVAEILEETQPGLGKAGQANLRLLLDYPDSEAATMLRDLMGTDGREILLVALPTEFKLNHPYPNPFNPSTTISYELPKMADITIAVYDILGRNVWSYEAIAQPAGQYSLQWSGLNNNGKLAASGVYLISFSTPEFRAVQKAVLIR